MTVVVIVIAPFFVAIIIATWSGGRSSAELLGMWSTWSVARCSLLSSSTRLTVACSAARRGCLDGSAWLADSLAWLA
jgi:hypothetical protein